jgi:hypothetical protein
MDGFYQDFNFALEVSNPIILLENGDTNILTGRNYGGVFLNGTLKLGNGVGLAGKVVTFADWNDYLMIDESATTDAMGNFKVGVASSYDQGDLENAEVTASYNGQSDTIYVSSTQEITHQLFVDATNLHFWVIADIGAERVYGGGYYIYGGGAIEVSSYGSYDSEGVFHFYGSAIGSGWAWVQAYGSHGWYDSIDFEVP